MLKFSNVMNKLQSFILLVVLLVTQGCNENGEPEPEPVGFLTVSLAADYFLYGGDMWVFASDETGKVLDAHPMKTDTTVTLKALSPPEFVNLTIYKNNVGSPIHHRFYTYARIARGEKITLAGEQYFGFVPSLVGNATVNILNCPNALFNISDGFSHLQFGTIDESAEALFDLRQESTNILISSRTAIDQPVYGWLNNVFRAEERTVDFNTLTPFPKTISISFSEDIYVGLSARKTTNVSAIGFVMANESLSKNPNDPTPGRIGFLDLEGFDEYWLNASSLRNDMSTYYRTNRYVKRGVNLPEEITLAPANSLTIENPSINNFKFTYSSPYTYCMNEWIQDGADYTMRWYVYTDKAVTPPITELPEALSAKYPLLSVNNLTYSRSDFYKYVDGYTYSQFLHDTFGGITLAPCEYFLESFEQK